MPNGIDIFPEIQEKLNGLTAGSVCKPCSHYRQNKKMEWANQIFGMIGVEMGVVSG